MVMAAAMEAAVRTDTVRIDTVRMDQVRNDAVRKGGNIGNTEMSAAPHPHTSQVDADSGCIADTPDCSDCNALLRCAMECGEERRGKRKS